MQNRTHPPFLLITLCLIFFFDSNAQSDSLWLSSPYDFLRFGSTTLETCDSTLPGKKKIIQNQSATMETSSSGFKSTYFYDYYMFSEDDSYQAYFRKTDTNLSKQTPLLSMMFYPKSAVEVNNSIVPKKASLSQVKKVFGNPSNERFLTQWAAYCVGYRLKFKDQICEVLFIFEENKKEALLHSILISEPGTVHKYLSWFSFENEIFTKD